MTKAAISVLLVLVLQAQAPPAPVADLTAVSIVRSERHGTVPSRWMHMAEGRTDPAIHGQRRKDSTLPTALSLHGRQGRRAPVRRRRPGCPRGNSRIGPCHAAHNTTQGSGISFTSAAAPGGIGRPVPGDHQEGCPVLAPGTSWPRLLLAALTVTLEDAIL
jgi:hypothetical protein